MFKKSERKLMLLKKRRRQQQLENKFDTPHTAHRHRRRPYNIIEIFSHRNVYVVFLFLLFSFLM